MKKLLFLGLLAFAVACESPTAPKPQIKIQTDTLIHYDTTFVHDTTIKIDTIIHTDTTIYVDTLYLPSPDLWVLDGNWFGDTFAFDVVNLTIADRGGSGTVTHIPAPVFANDSTTTTYNVTINLMSMNAQGDSLIILLYASSNKQWKLTVPVSSFLHPPVNSFGGAWKEYINGQWDNYTHHLTLVRQP